MTKTGVNNKLLNQKNRGLLLKLIATGECSSRIELAQKTGLAKMTVSNIVSEFIELYLFPFISAEPLQPPDRTPQTKPFFGNTKIAQNPNKRHFGQYLSPATTEK